MQVECRHLGCSYHRADGDHLSVTSESVSTASAPCAADDLGATETKQDLLDVIDGQSLPRGNVAAGDRPFGRASRKMQGADDAILGQSGNAHDWTLRLDWESYKAGRLSQPRPRRGRPPVRRS